MSSSLRSQRKNEHLAKKRILRLQTLSQSTASGPGVLQTTPTDVHMMFNKLESQDPKKCLEGFSSLREFISIDQTNQRLLLERPGMLSRIVGMLSQSGFPELQGAAAWCVTSLASTTTDVTSALINADAVSPLVELIFSEDAALQNQAVWALANIAGDSIDARDFVWSSGAVERVEQILRADDLPLLVKQNAVWFLSNMCRYEPKPPLERTSALLTVLHPQLYCEDDETVRNALWAISFIAGGSTEQVQSVIHCGCLTRVVKLLDDAREELVLPCLSILGNVSYGTEAQARHLTAHGLCAKIKNLIRAGSPSIIGDACWIASNLAGTSEAMVAVLHREGVMREGVRLLRSPMKRVRRMAVWMVHNATSKGDADTVAAIAEGGAIEALVEFLNFTITGQNDSADTVLDALNSLYNFLVMHESDDSGVNRAAALMESCGGYSVLDELRYHKSATIYDKATEIIQDFFEDDNESTEMF
eukprot:gnl/Chilomastix_cuspidata/2143.p1 GENE.gnl/Chilomastix_cuspidata/2143~~gnl/Chilomastix_cuspidata/2143.p1  ORF type:complete len:512 (-),score=213.38 gnl/Chilomastix_cuspidata/2143:264-1688(-)